jgi:hypothetical protein
MSRVTICPIFGSTVNVNFCGGSTIRPIISRNKRGKKFGGHSGLVEMSLGQSVGRSSLKAI